MVAPMFLVSGPDLVLGACKEGVMGTFPFPNARTIDVLDDWLSQITKTLQKWTTENPDCPPAPFAANMVAHSSYGRLSAELELIAKYQPPVVITALGSPKPVIEVVHAYGGLVFADVNSVPYAKKAVAAGADGLVLVGAGAGGHTGHMSGFALVSAVREFFSGPVILGGSICNGGGIRAAEVLGANIASMGTSFIAAEESLADSTYKEMILAAEFEDLVLSNALTGAHAYYLRESLLKMGLDPDNLGKKAGPDFSDSENQVKAWRDIWSAGHGVGTVTKVRPIADIIDELKAQYQAAVDLPHCAIAT
ncbi:2-nitropropane dioxygenase [Kordiimonas sediminis]|uniref:2-nitropropane dioxygenase n=2 Tax=Kordiimonas sediminis TaxID=1735581 RepID=A0A919AMW5_9PROT|nr:2-nitropropane dioxygenase [Kordiimonas sediminis]